MIAVTVIITSCNRLDLLKKTLDSFIRFNSYPIQEYFLHNDGPDMLTRMIKERYPFIKFFDSPIRIGIAESLDLLLSKVKTDYVFSTEDDWYYYHNPGFIQKSLKILEENPNIHQVWIRDDNDHSHPLSSEEVISGIKVRQVLYNDPWNGYTWNPGLRRMADIKRMFPNGLVQHRDEIDQAKHVQQFNYKAVALVDSTIKHIGAGRRSKDFQI